MTRRTTNDDHTTALSDAMRQIREGGMTRRTTLGRPAGACRSNCPHGRSCCCDASIEHRLHICSNPTCDCHSRQRYERTGEPRHER